VSASGDVVVFKNKWGAGLLFVGPEFFFDSQQIHSK
jgi:hypothetical protein